MDRHAVGFIAVLVLMAIIGTFFCVVLPAGVGTFFGVAVPAGVGTIKSLYYTQAELTTLKALRTSPSHSAIWNNVQSWANTHVSDSLPAYAADHADVVFRQYMENMIFMYHMTDNTTYANAALSWMRGASTTWADYGGAGRGEQSRSEVLFGMATGYYALRNYMDSSNQTTILAKMVTETNELYNHYAPWGSGFIPSPFPNVESCYGSALGMSALAIGTDSTYSTAWMTFSLQCLN